MYLIFVILFFQNERNYQQRGNYYSGWGSVQSDSEKQWMRHDISMCYRFMSFPQNVMIYDIRRLWIPETVLCLAGCLRCWQLKEMKFVIIDDPAAAS